MKRENYLFPVMVLIFITIVTSCYQVQVVENENYTELDSLNEIFLDAIREASPTGDESYHFIPTNTEYDKIPQDPKNPITAEKVKLGMMLYHDPAAGTIPKDPNNFQKYSCATCHPADCEYQPGVAQGIGEGGVGYGLYGEGRTYNGVTDLSLIDVQPTKTPSALNFAYANNTLWNGSLGAGGFNTGTEHLWKEFPHTVNKLGLEGLETQAFAGLTVHRISISPEWVEQYGYKRYFDAAYPDVDEAERYTNFNAGMAIAAYERTMLTNCAPFQYYIKGDDKALTISQVKGGILFYGKARCINCHTSPVFANTDEMKCIGLNDFNEENSLNSTPQLGRYGFTGQEEDKYLYKVPQLYNLKGVGFYGHGSSLPSLRAMINYCAHGQVENPAVDEKYISVEFVNAGLSKTEIDYLDDFVRNALYDPLIKRHLPEYVASGFCFPNNDAQAKIDLGCK